MKKIVSKAFTAGLVCIILIGSTRVVSAYSGSTPSDFTVTDDMLSQDKSYIVTITDNYYDEDVLIKSEIREQKSIREGAEYSFSPLDIDGYMPVSNNTIKGVVNQDLTIEFNYKKVAEPTPEQEVKRYTVTVIDELRKANGDLIESRTRCVDTYNAGSSYEYSALEYDNFNVMDVLSTKGVVNQDTVVVFQYKEKELNTEIENLHILRVRDIFYDVDGTLIRDGTRLVEANLKEGYRYNYKALSVIASYKVYYSSYKNGVIEQKEEVINYDYYKVVGNPVIVGSLSEDTDVVFQYVKCNIEGDLPDKIPELVILENKPLEDTIISSDPPKTGDETNLPVIFIMITCSSLIILQSLRKKIR